MKHNKVKTLLAKRPRRRKKKDVSERFTEAVQTLPRITNDTVAAHREEVLSKARKYIYPLQHSKHRIVLISTALLVTVVIAFFAYCGLALYRFQSTSGFLYGVTQILPFPVAKAGPSYVAYENYLFELRHYVHYYQTQQQVNFNSVAGKEQLASFKKQAMQNVINNAYIKQLATKNHISISNQELNNEVALVERQDNLGNNQKEFETVLNQFWGWSLSDFKRELGEQMLAQKVVSKLDTATNDRALAALTSLQNGADFSKVAAQYSDDLTTKTNGGQFGFSIDANNRNVSAQTLETLFSLKPGQISDIVNIGGALEIDKVISNQNGNIQAAHILFNFQNINTYLQPLEKTEKTHIFIKQPA